MSCWICSHELLTVPRCCWGQTEGLCHFPRLNRCTCPCLLGESAVLTLHFILCNFLVQTLATAAPSAFMEMETSIVTSTSSSSQQLPGNCKMHFKVLWVHLFDLLHSYLPKELQYGLAASLVSSPLLLCGQLESCFNKLGLSLSLRRLSQNLLFIRWEV